MPSGASFPRTYAEVRDAIRGALLERFLAVGVARKGIGFLGSVASTGPAPSLWGQFSVVGMGHPDDAPGGFVFSYLAHEEFDFPYGHPNEFPTLTVTSPFNVKRYGDSRSVGEGRMVVNVREPGASGSALSAYVFNGSFVGAAPSCPLDVAGMHISEWVPVVLPSPTISPNTLGPVNLVIIKWVVANPSLATTTAEVGLCQFQVKI